MSVTRYALFRRPIITSIAGHYICIYLLSTHRNTTVDLTHIETPANMNYWPQFHNGVAAGLKVANMSQVFKHCNIMHL